MTQGATQSLTVERVISAVGVVGNVENLGLEKAGVKVERGVVVVDGFGRTNVPGIYAIGDVAGAPLLAHKAEHEGVICVGHQGPEDIHRQAGNPGCTTITQMHHWAHQKPRAEARSARHFLPGGGSDCLGEDQAGSD
jgi:pyruvate/2-oxoglutarate dehydrogenase complex dihydrolipoamide dehydrogenase (E3) component